MPCTQCRWVFNNMHCNQMFRGDKAIGALDTLPQADHTDTDVLTRSNTASECLLSAFEKAGQALAWEPPSCCTSVLPGTAPTCCACTRPCPRCWLAGCSCSRCCLPNNLLHRCCHRTARTLHSAGLLVVPAAAVPPRLRCSALHAAGRAAERAAQLGLRGRHPQTLHLAGARSHAG
jgi:hypothetical protein